MLNVTKLEGSPTLKEELRFILDMNNRILDMNQMILKAALQPPYIVTPADGDE